MLYTIRGHNRMPHELFVPLQKQFLSPTRQRGDITDQMPPGCPSSRCPHGSSVYISIRSRLVKNVMKIFVKNHDIIIYHKSGFTWLINTKLMYSLKSTLSSQVEAETQRGCMLLLRHLKWVVWLRRVILLELLGMPFVLICNRRHNWKDRDNKEEIAED